MSQHSVASKNLVPSRRRSMSRRVGDANQIAPTSTSDRTHRVVDHHPPPARLAHAEAIILARRIGACALGAFALGGARPLSSARPGHDVAEIYTSRGGGRSTHASMLRGTRRRFDEGGARQKYPVEMMGQSKPSRDGRSQQNTQVVWPTVHWFGSKSIQSPPLTMTTRA